LLAEQNKIWKIEAGNCPGGCRGDFVGHEVARHLSEIQGKKNSLAAAYADKTDEGTACF